MAIIQRTGEQAVFAGGPEEKSETVIEKCIKNRNAATKEEKNVL